MPSLRITHWIETNDFRLFNIFPNNPTINIVYTKLSIFSSSQNIITQDCSLHPTSQVATNLLKQGQASGRPTNCCLNKPNLSEIMQAEKQSSLHPELVLILGANPISDNNYITNISAHSSDLSPPSQNISLLSVIKKE